MENKGEFKFLHFGKVIKIKRWNCHLYILLKKKSLIKSLIQDSTEVLFNKMKFGYLTFVDGLNILLQFPSYEIVLFESEYCLNYLF